jgi:hypothetical protein
MSKDELEGRVRAIEAILLELPEVTPQVIEAAKTRVRDPKHHPHPDVAEGMLKMSGHLDVHAEKALNKLKDRAESRREEHGRGPPVASPEITPLPSKRPSIRRNPQGSG